MRWLLHWLRWYSLICNNLYAKNSLFLCPGRICRMAKVLHWLAVLVVATAAAGVLADSDRSCALACNCPNEQSCTRGASKSDCCWTGAACFKTSATSSRCSCPSAGPDQDYGCIGPEGPLCTDLSFIGITTAEECCAKCASLCLNPGNAIIAYTFVTGGGDANPTGGPCLCKSAALGATFPQLTTTGDRVSGRVGVCQ